MRLIPAPRVTLHYSLVFRDAPSDAVTRRRCSPGGAVVVDAVVAVVAAVSIYAVALF